METNTSSIEEKNKEVAFYQKTLEFLRLGNKAVQKAREENKQKGLPNVFSRNGIIYYELPTGEITTQSPFNK
jgi:hypothetical protein